MKDRHKMIFLNRREMRGRKERNRKKGEKEKNNLIRRDGNE